MMPEDELARHFSELTEWVSPWLYCALATVAMQLGTVLVSWLLTRLSREKPKRTGEKLKRGNGEVLDVIQEKRKNDANDPRMP